MLNHSAFPLCIGLALAATLRISKIRAPFF